VVPAQFSKKSSVKKEVRTERANAVEDGTVGGKGRPSCRRFFVQGSKVEEGREARIGAGGSVQGVANRDKDLERNETVFGSVRDSEWSEVGQVDLKCDKRGHK
jgi:hypothetical protein